jgi:hypothetical protein
MGKPSDRNADYMKTMWGTTKLSTDYGVFSVKRKNFTLQNEIHSKIRNDHDYDDWEYGTEPLYGAKNPNK